MIKFAKKLFYRHKINKNISTTEKNFLKNFKNPNIKDKAKDEDLYVKKWEGLGIKVNPIYFRVFSNHELGHDLNFVPIDLYYISIQNRLNNYSFGLAYADKNLLDKWLDQKLFPKTYLRNINGAYFTPDYNIITPGSDFFVKLSLVTKEVIVKPALSSGKGVNVRKFIWKDDAFYDSASNKLSLSYLQEHYTFNFLLQEVVKQHTYLEQLNHTSTNTLRVFTYRSVKDEEIKILGTYLRIGKEGSIVDNVMAGGYLIYIKEDGWPDDIAKLNYEGKADSINGIKLNELGAYPEYDKIIECAKNIARFFPYQRMLGLDMIVDQDNNVKIIEINTYVIGSLSYSGYPVFGKYTDEIIEYCREKIIKEDADLK